jgi:hypothetical protein
MKIKTISYLTQDEMSRLLEAITNKRDYALVLLAYHDLRAAHQLDQRPAGTETFCEP